MESRVQTITHITIFSIRAKKTLILDNPLSSGGGGDMEMIMINKHPRKNSRVSLVLRQHLHFHHAVGT